MTISKAILAVAIFSVAGCASRTEQVACGPALPPIATAAHEPPPPGFLTPGSAAVATAAPAATPAAPAALTPAQIRAQNPMENRAAVAGR